MCRVVREAARAVESLQAACQLPPAARVSRAEILADAAPQRSAARKLPRARDGRSPVDGRGRTQCPLDSRLLSHSTLSGTAGMPSFSRSSHSLESCGSEGGDTLIARDSRAYRVRGFRVKFSLRVVRRCFTNETAALSVFKVPEPEHSLRVGSGQKQTNSGVVTDESLKSGCFGTADRGRVHFLDRPKALYSHLVLLFQPKR